MTSQSPPSTPSEGEIIESESEKATTSLHTLKDNKVNPQSRHRVSVSRSPSPIRSLIPSPRSYRSRTRSRSPYREPRGAKRPRDDDHYHDRSREDTRRFKIRFEDRSSDDRRRANKSYDIGRSNRPDPRSSYNDRYDQSSFKRHRTRSRSPYSRSSKPGYGRGGERNRDSRRNGQGYPDQGRRGYEETRKGFSREQSVSDRGHSPVATASSRQKAETRHDQTHKNDKSETSNDRSAAEYVLYHMGS